MAKKYILERRRKPFPAGPWENWEKDEVDRESFSTFIGMPRRKRTFPGFSMIFEEGHTLREMRGMTRLVRRSPDMYAVIDDLLTSCVIIGDKSEKIKARMEEILRDIDGERETPEKPAREQERPQPM